ncbi:MAG: hypothetical protein NTX25_09555 [Proteobacteria bacterium]|nr:hypothetical protein [Pseudomonadota bacterium]
MPLRLLSMLCSGLILVSLAACNKSPKLASNRSLNGATGGAIKGADDGTGKTPGPNPSVAALPTGLVLDNTKLNLLGGPLVAKINLNGQLLSENFTPSGPQTVIKLSSLSPVPEGLLTVEIYQGEVLKFIAKKSRIALTQPASDLVVVDDCLILTVPWTGKSSEGSCEWTVIE